MQKNGDDFIILFLFHFIFQVNIEKNMAKSYKSPKL